MVKSGERGRNESQKRENLTCLVNLFCEYMFYSFSVSAYITFPSKFFKGHVSTGARCHNYIEGSLMTLLIPLGIEVLLVTPFVGCLTLEICYCH